MLRSRKSRESAGLSSVAREVIVARIDLNFRKSLSGVEKVGDLGQCFQCSACLPDCPAASFSPRFNPRDIVMRALLGLESSLVCSDSLVWDCTTCYACAERCPQGVKPVEVITAIKNRIAEAGLLPKEVAGAVANIKETDRVIVYSDAVERRRKELGLPGLDSGGRLIQEVLRGDGDG